MFNLNKKEVSEAKQNDLLKFSKSVLKHEDGESPDFEEDFTTQVENSDQKCSKS